MLVDAMASQQASHSWMILFIMTDELSWDLLMIHRNVNKHTLTPPPLKVVHIWLVFQSGGCCFFIHGRDVTGARGSDVHNGTTWVAVEFDAHVATYYWRHVHVERVWSAHAHQVVVVIWLKSFRGSICEAISYTWKVLYAINGYI